MTNKTTLKRLKLDPYFSKTIDTNLNVWSHDQNSYEIKFEFYDHQCDKPIDLTGADMRILLDHADSKPKIYTLEIESKVLGLAKFIMPKEIRGCEGKFIAHIYADYPNKTHDFGSFTFYTKLSRLDGDLGGCMDEIYVSEFEKALEDIKNFKVGIDKNIDDMQEHFDDRYNKAKGDLQDIEKLIESNQVITNDFFKEHQTYKDITLFKNDNNDTFPIFFEKIQKKYNKLYLPAGEYTVDSSMKIDEGTDLLVNEKAKIHIKEGVKLEVLGNISSQNEIFYGDGVVSFEGGYNHIFLHWFDGETLNEKFDFAKRSFREYKKKVIVIEKPRPNFKGVYTDVGGRFFWKLDGPLIFDDDCNASSVYNFGEWYTDKPIESFIKIAGVDKPEDIYFYGNYNLLSLNKENPPKGGVVVKEGARIIFFNQLLINGVETPIELGGENQHQPADLVAYALQCSFFKKTGVKLYGNAKSGYASSITLYNPSFTSVLTEEDTSAIEIKGIVRSAKIIGSVSYSDETKNGWSGKNVKSVLKIGGAENDDVDGVLVNCIDSLHADTALKINGHNKEVKVRNIFIENIRKKYEGNSFDVNNCSNVSIGEIKNGNCNGIFRENAAACNVNSYNVINLVDLGKYTTINMLGKQTRGGGVPPSPEVKWPVGCFVLETSDNSLYLRVGNKQQSDDFIKIK